MLGIPSAKAWLANPCRTHALNSNHLLPDVEPARDAGFPTMSIVAAQERSAARNNISMLRVYMNMSVWEYAELPDGICWRTDLPSAISYGKPTATPGTPLAPNTWRVFARAHRS